MCVEDGTVKGVDEDTNIICVASIAAVVEGVEDKEATRLVGAAVRPRASVDVTN